MSNIFEIFEGCRDDGSQVFLSDIWPSREEIAVSCLFLDFLEELS